MPGLEQGRVYSGREALEHKLVDRIGGETEAQKWLEEQRGITAGLKIVDWKPKDEDSWGLFGMDEPSVNRADRRAAPCAFSDLRPTIHASACCSLDGLVSVWQPSKN